MECGIRQGGVFCRECLFRPFGDAVRDPDRKGGALARLALDRNGAAHELCQLLGDAHTEAKARPSALRAAPLAREGFENVREEFLLHTDAIVPDGRREELDALLGRSGADIERHPPSGRCVLACIREKIQQDLLQLHLIGIDEALRRPKRPCEGDLSVPHLIFKKAADRLIELFHVDDRLLDTALAAFDARKLKDIVDKRKQEFTGLLDLFCIVQDPLRLILVHAKQVGEAKDRIHRRADIMRHIEEEGGLRLIGEFDLAERFFQLLLFLPLLMDDLIQRAVAYDDLEMIFILLGKHRPHFEILIPRRIRTHMAADAVHLMPEKLLLEARG